MRAWAMAISLLFAAGGCRKPLPPPPVPLAPSEAATAASLRDRVLHESRAYEHLRSLTDEVGARLAGSPGDRAAVAWAERTMRALGLVNVHTEAVMVPRWERGAEQAQLIAPRLRAMAVTALGGSVATPPSGVEADVVEVTSEAELARLGRAEVEGKILFFHIPMERTRDGTGYGNAVVWRGRAANEGAKRGAVAALIRSVGTDHDRSPHTGAFRYEDGLPKIPAGALSVPDAEVLHRTLAEGHGARIRLALASTALPDAPSANVIGEVVGASRPGEIVLLGAHLDSWDLGDGAADDGAGCVMALEAARQIANASPRPARTVRVVLFANEENGLRGADAYAALHESELGGHVVALESDSGDGRVYAARFAGSEAGRRAFDGLARLLVPLGVGVDPGPAQGGADISPLRPAGVSIVDLRQDESRYFDVHHTENDTLARIVKADLDQATAALATIAYGLAATSADLGRR